jgi:hypothetical protein
VTITPGNYSTETNDMRAVHGALRRALGSAQALVAGAGNDPAKVATVSSFYENVLEFLHVHHEGEDNSFRVSISSTPSFTNRWRPRSRPSEPGDLTHRPAPLSCTL